MPNTSVPPSSGTLLGVNSLQGVIDKFTTAVNKLDTVVSSLGAAPTGFGRSSGGNSSSPQQQPSYGTFPPVQNPFSGSGTIKPILSYSNQTGQTTPTGAYQFSYAGQAQPGQSFPNGGGSAPSGPSGGSGGGGGAFGMPTTMGGAASGFWGSVKGFGQAQLPIQAAMSSYTQQGTLAAPNGMSNGTASQMLLRAAVGSGPGNINAIANNPMDAIQGQSLINWSSGSFAGSNRLGGAMTGAANMFGYANQGLGYTGSAQLANTMYSSQMSMRMLQMGYGATPRAMGGGKPTSSPGVLGNMMQYWYQGRRSVNQNVLNAGLGPNGHITANLGALGYSGSSLTDMEATLQGYNKLANAGYTNNQISGLFTGARQDNQGAINKLTGAGITQSDLQDIKNNTAAKSATTGNEVAGFTAGLRQSVGLLTQFNKALSFITGGPLGKVLGWAGGIGSGASIAHTSGATGFLSNGLGLVTGGLSMATKMFGGAASTSSTSTTSQAGPARSTMSSGGVSPAGAAAAQWAEKELGVPYVWGGEQPGIGFDCSGLTQWAYARAGVSIPRTSQSQWSALKNRSVPLNSVQEGDLIFSAGQGDGGTYDSPGHVAMMVSSSHLIQAPYTGADVEIIPYSPGDWQHAARPSGSLASGSFPSGTNTSSGSGGMGFAASAPSSVSEADNISSALGGMAMGMGGTNAGSTTSSNATSLGGSGGAVGGNPPAGSSAAQVQALAKQAAAKRGWTGSLWTDLNNVEMREAGWNLKAQNPSSGAYGIAQFINGSSEYYQYGGNPNTPQGQVTAFENYVQDRYHGPAGAWAHEQADNWYGQGTRNARRGLAVVGDRGPEVVDFGGGEKVAPLWQANSLLGTKMSGSGTGCSIVLQFGQGSVQITGTGTGSDVSNSAREFAQNIGKYLEQEDVIKKIAAGVS